MAAPNLALAVPTASIYRAINIVDHVGELPRLLKL